MVIDEIGKADGYSLDAIIGTLVMGKCKIKLYPKTGELERLSDNPFLSLQASNGHIAIPVFSEVSKGLLRDFVPRNDIIGQLRDLEGLRRRAIG